MNAKSKKNTQINSGVEKKAVVVTPLMEKNFAILSDLIETRKYKEMSAVDNAKYNAAFTQALNKFSYIVDIHTNKYKKFSNYDDLKQEGMIGLVYALLNFKPERSKNFFKLANWYIKTKVKRSANKHLVVNIPMHLAKDVQMISQNDVPNKDIANSDFDLERLYDQEQKMYFMAKSYQKLSKVQKQLVGLYYGFSVNKNNSIVCNNNSLTITSIAKLTKMPRKDIEEELVKANEIMVQNFTNSYT